MHKVIGFFCGAVMVLFCGCTVTGCVQETSESGKEKSRNAETGMLKIVTWNAQTFFDSVKDGTEYSEFKNASSRWNRDAYLTRLDRLCEVMKTLNADVYVLEELENEGELYDISNRFAGNSWDSSSGWNYGCFAKNEGDAIGCGILSKYPLGAFSVHSLDIRTENCTPPQMRPIMQVSVIADNKSLILLVNHWKSKSGGKAQSEIWRNWEESVLAEKIVNAEQSAVLACGDFNRDIYEFTQSAEKGFIVLRNAGFGTAAAVQARTPWIHRDGTAEPEGSYYYDENWEKIDNFFAAGKAEISEFAAEKNGNWADGSGIPKKYLVYTGYGYSDHLPLSCSVEF